MFRPAFLLFETLALVAASTSHGELLPAVTQQKGDYYGGLDDDFEYLDSDSWEINRSVGEHAETDGPDEGGSDDDSAEGSSTEDEGNTSQNERNAVTRPQHDRKKKKGSEYNAMEAKFMINYDLRPLDIGRGRSRKLIANDELLERITVIQKMIVRTRTLMVSELIKKAYAVTSSIEYDFPQKHSCAVQVYNFLIYRDWPGKYPYGLLNLVYAVKEALFTSQVDQIPIALVNEDVYKRLEFVVNRLGERLKDHGQLAYRIFDETVIDHKRFVRKICGIPRRPPLVELDFNYTAEDSSLYEVGD